MTDSSDPGEFILTLSCADVPGIVYAVSSFLVQHQCSIVQSQQFGDRDTGQFFMRVHFESSDAQADLEELRAAFGWVGDSFKMTWELTADAARQRILLMVSKYGHCLNDLLYRHSVGALNIEIPAIVSNHQDFETFAATYSIPFHHLPVTPATKPGRGPAPALWSKPSDIELVVLARYMQVLSNDLCEPPARAASSTSTTRSCPASRAQALPPGPRARRQDDRRHRPLRDAPTSTKARSSSRRSRRVNHASRPTSSSPRPRHREPGAGACGQVAQRAPRPAQRQSHGGVPLSQRSQRTGTARADQPTAPRSAASTTLSSSIARVIGPTPPGIGATYDATSRTDGSTSPTRPGVGARDAHVEDDGARPHHVGLDQRRGRRPRRRRCRPAGDGRRGHGCRCGTA